MGSFSEVFFRDGSFLSASKCRGKPLRLAPLDGRFPPPSFDRYEVNRFFFLLFRRRPSPVTARGRAFFFPCVKPWEGNVFWAPPFSPSGRMPPFHARADVEVTPSFSFSSPPISFFSDALGDTRDYPSLFHLGRQALRGRCVCHLPFPARLTLLPLKRWPLPPFLLFLSSVGKLPPNFRAISPQPFAEGVLAVIAISFACFPPHACLLLLSPQRPSPLWFYRTRASSFLDGGPERRPRA